MPNPPVGVLVRRWLLCACFLVSSQQGKVLGPARYFSLANVLNGIKLLFDELFEVQLRDEVFDGNTPSEAWAPGQLYKFGVYHHGDKLACVFTT